MSYGTRWKHDELHVTSTAAQWCHDLMVSLWHILISYVICALEKQQDIFFLCTHMSAHISGMDFQWPT